MQPDDPNVMSTNTPASNEANLSHRPRPVVFIGVAVGIVMLLIGLYMIMSSMGSHGSRW